jgi:hypothetical protein
MLRFSALAATLAFAVACSDSTTQPSAASGGNPVLPATANHFATARGQIIAAGAGLVSPVTMLTDAGDTLRLIGPVAQELANAVGVELLVQGELSADGAMMVAAYSLRPDGAVCDDPMFRIIVDDPSQCGLTSAQRRPDARATLVRR